MTGDADIDPVLDLGGQIKDFEGHGSIPVQFLSPPQVDGGPTPLTRRGQDIDIALTDFNICQSISRDLLPVCQAASARWRLWAPAALRCQAVCLARAALLQHGLKNCWPGAGP